MDYCTEKEFETYYKSIGFKKINNNTYKDIGGNYFTKKEVYAMIESDRLKYIKNNCV